MRTIALSTLICLSAPDGTVAFHPTQLSNPTSSHSTRLEARRRDFSEIDMLTARRLALMRPEPEHIAYTEEEEDEGDMPMEYLYDRSEIRDDDAPFHVLLLPSTFNDRRTRIEDVASSCADVLDIPYDKAYELSMFAKYESFSVLGTWTRDECITIGEQLKELNVECRLVPREDMLDGWKCPDIVPTFDLQSESQVDIELSAYMDMQNSHDQDLESFMRGKKDQQKDEHPDSFSVTA